MRRAHYPTVLGVCIVGAAITVAPTDAFAVPQISLTVGGGEGPKAVGEVIKIVGVLTVLALAPAILMLLTCFTRIVIVLTFIRQSLGVQGMPPNQVLVGLALLLTAFLMAPVAKKVHRDGVAPYLAGKISGEEAFARGARPLRRFMLRHTRKKDLRLFLKVTGRSATTRDQTPLTALVPAFVVSELTVAFYMGFLIFIPFLLIDLVIASVLMSMGMVMLPPALISLPIKIMLFVLVDGWNLAVASLVRSVGG